MSNRGRSTTGEAQVPYYRQADHIEAAKHLRLTVTRYISDRASLDDIREAMTMLVAAAPVPGERGHHKGHRPVTADNITDEELASVRDDESCQLDERIAAAAAMSPDLPRSHGMKTRCRAKIVALLNARQAKP